MKMYESFFITDWNRKDDKKDQKLYWTGFDFAENIRWYVFLHFKIL